MNKLGIVVVTHVPELATGISRLLDEIIMDIPVTFAGGTNDNEVGTDLEKIEKALEENSGKRILAFYDIGSAKMKLEMAMDMCDKEVLIYDTALVESTYTAAALVQAGADFKTINKQLQALKVK